MQDSSSLARIEHMEMASAQSLSVIAIPTYRRPVRLERLLQSLEPSLRSTPARVIVGDNACQSEAADVVARFTARWPDTTYLPVPERGISSNRNALIEAFLSVPGTPQWLLMVDDDLTVPETWLRLMLDCAAGYDVDVVAAPYTLPSETGRFVIDQSIFVRRPRRPTGPCEPVASAGNILLSRRLLAGDSNLRFRAEYGLSGGEDYDFFRAASVAGARFAWCDEALAYEEVDPKRLKVAAILMRYYSTGNYMGPIDRRYEGALAAWRRQGSDLLKALGIILQGALCGNRERLLRGLFLTCFTLGALAGLSGLRVYRYS